jgi:hypothetical protein
MQYKWREDLLLEEKRARLQEKMDQFLGKVSSAQCAETPMSLLPIVLQEPHWPEGPDPFAQPEPPEWHEPRDACTEADLFDKFEPRDEHES